MKKKRMFRKNKEQNTEYGRNFHKNLSEERKYF